ncbi:hypothetical protein ACPXCX_47045, partial [Streptomyces sp. DT225]
PFVRGGETEQRIRDRLRRSTVKPGDLENALINLSRDPAGGEIADIIASGKLKDAKNFGQVVSTLSHVSKMPGSIEQIRLANRLYESGVHDISFEIKGGIEIAPGRTTGKGTDLDVMARDANGRIH